MSIIRWPVAAAAAALVLAASGACHYGSTSPAAQPSASPSPGPALSTARLSAQDKTWLGQAHQGNVAEGELGELARSKSGDPKVESDGAALQNAHDQMDQTLVTTAHRLDVTLPTSPTADQAAQREDLGGLTGSAFDTKLVADLVTDHQDAIGMAQYEVDHGSDQVVVGLARQAIPQMRQHLAMLKQAQH